MEGRARGAASMIFKRLSFRWLHRGRVYATVGRERSVLHMTTKPGRSGYCLRCFHELQNPFEPVVESCGGRCLRRGRHVSSIRRRAGGGAQIRDTAVARRREVADYASTQAKRAADQARGAIAGLRADWLAGDASDVQVAERVRSALGRLVARPRDVDVRVERGRVTLTGQIEESERQAVVDGVAALHGVRRGGRAGAQYKAPTDGHSS